MSRLITPAFDFESNSSKCFTLSCFSDSLTGFCVFLLQREQPTVAKRAAAAKVVGDPPSSLSLFSSQVFGLYRTHFRRNSKWNFFLLLLLRASNSGFATLGQEFAPTAVLFYRTFNFTTILLPDKDKNQGQKASTTCSALLPTNTEPTVLHSFPL